ncbi:MAG TPA: hypothetical protein PLS06_08075 [Proteiniphilum sp.]|nr:hypothetical protein [Proteiniphilum sp.]
MSDGMGTISFILIIASIGAWVSADQLNKRETEIGELTYELCEAKGGSRVQCLAECLDLKPGPMRGCTHAARSQTQTIPEIPGTEVPEETTVRE